MKVFIIIIAIIAVASAGYIRSAGWNSGYGGHSGWSSPGWSSGWSGHSGWSTPRVIKVISHGGWNNGGWNNGGWNTGSYGGGHGWW